ncbi:hypothetical protein HMPREF0541_02377 [Lacticaseibacillus rhamnosus ATCC 21052]|jgi:hypothetical protein|nr:hypothetical protein HMPREF0541_02377 [Lacticaseibacillus rhamnosus ATCC 21052]
MIKEVLQMENGIYIVDEKDEVWDIDEASGMYGMFSSKPNIGPNEVAALLSGKALVDLSDGEYIHWIQLTPDAIKTARLRQ